jgi:hypothetical protein
LRIGEREATLSSGWLRGRPVVIEVVPSLVLTKRLTIPAAGRRDLPFAVKLLIEAETPFGANEVLADVSLARSLPETGELAFEVRLIPRQRVMDALAEVRLKPSQVRGIAVSEDPRPLGIAGLAAARRTLFHTQLGWLTPLVIGVGALVVWMYLETESKRVLIAALEQKIAAELTTLRAQLHELDERDAGAEQQRTVHEAFAATPSSFAVLSSLRANLPDSAYVNRVQMQAGEFRFAVTTPDALRDVKALQEGLIDFDARIEGSVVDMPDGLQATSFLITPRVRP